jgi:hypothetical protein
MAAFYTASMRLRNGTLIASVGSATLCEWSFARALTLPMLALTLSAAASTGALQLCSSERAEQALDASTPRSPRYKLAQWLWPLSCSDLSGR